MSIELPRGRLAIVVLVKDKNKGGILLPKSNTTDSDRFRLGRVKFGGDSFLMPEDAVVFDTKDSCIVELDGDPLYVIDYCKVIVKVLSGDQSLKDMVESPGY